MLLIATPNPSYRLNYHDSYRIYFGIKSWAVFVVRLSGTWDREAACCTILRSRLGDPKHRMNDFTSLIMQG